jgi:hypothetical protein
LEAVLSIFTLGGEVPLHTNASSLLRCSKIRNYARKGNEVKKKPSCKFKVFFLDIYSHRWEFWTPSLCWRGKD